MDYFTVDGVKLRTGYKSERDWYLLPIRELLDNAADFLTKHYRGSSDTYIKTWIIKDDKLLHIRVRNSNHKNIPVFEELAPIFDYDMRYGSKQNVYIISRGMLGDALKQVLSLGYVLLHIHDDGNSFVDQQWDHPLIIRHNGYEQNLYLRVDKASQTGNVTIENSHAALADTDTEIEVTLPSNVELFMPKSDIVEFCKTYPIFTTDISFEFRIVENSTKPQEYEEVIGYTRSHEKVLDKALSREPPKAITRLEFSALHAIGKERWTNSNSIYSYRPEEFKNRIINVHSKSEIMVYDVLRTYREGSNLPKSKETTMTVDELIQDPEKDKKIERWYKQLKKTLRPSEELVLPYTTTNKERMGALVSRAGQIAPIDNETKTESAYKVIRGFHQDEHGIIQFPFVFEMLAVPLEIPTIDGKPFIKNKTRFLGAVNYSVSPLSNTFEGDYKEPDDKKTFVPHETNSTSEILEQCGFHQYYGSKSRLPCIIIANLITPRRDPHGYDKSRIDTEPFTKIIAETTRKVAAEIPTFRAAGYRFSDESDYSTARWHSVEKNKSVRDLLKDFLVKERGLPAV